MRTYSNIFIRSTLLLLPAILLIMAIAVRVNGQTDSRMPAQEEVATVVDSTASNPTTANVPVFTEYRGVRIGMKADEVRAKLEGLKHSPDSADLDFLIFSERESAQIHYDEEGKVTAVSIDYFGNNVNAPTAIAVLGTAIEPRADGSLYQLKRYPEAGYWVSYYRTAGDKPLVTVTMQKL